MLQIVLMLAMYPAAQHAVSKVGYGSWKKSSVWLGSRMISLKAPHTQGHLVHTAEVVGVFNIFICSSPFK